MSGELNVIIVDDDPNVCEIVSQTIQSFYTWGEVISFTDIDEATRYCLRRDIGVGIFVIDVFLGGKSGFDFLDKVEEKYPAVYEDTIMITGYASDSIVNMCISADVNYLMEKPIKPYALQLSIRSIVMKYIKFAKRLLQDPIFATEVSNFSVR